MGKPNSANGPQELLVMNYLRSFNYDLHLNGGKSVKDLEGNEAKTILRKEDSAFIPFDEANTDYQEYLEWVAEGNTPEAAD